MKILPVQKKKKIAKPERKKAIRQAEAGFYGLLGAFLLHLVVISLVIMTPNELYAKGHDDPLKKLRTYFIESVDSREAIKEAERYIASLEGTGDPLIQAYDAMFSIMHAKHVFWPGKKMDYLKAGLPVLDSLILQYPDYSEIRYLRLLGCYYLPRILDRGWSVKEDFQALAQQLPGQENDFPPELYRDMVQFVYEKGIVGETEKDQLRTLLAQLEASLLPGSVSPHKGSRSTGN